MGPASESRKREHLRIAREERVTSSEITPGFEKYRFEHVSLPEMRLSEASTRTTFLGKSLAAPLLISSMTGGTPEAREINRTLAGVAEQFEIALALGSSRPAIEDSRLADTYQVRDVAPHTLLMANLGAVQLNYGYGYDECMRVLDETGADALILHLNPLQEALQPEGNTDFRGLLPKISAICARLPYPVIVKEVGWGISGVIAKRLVEAGVSAIDVAGAGGTSWSEVESFRIADETDRQVAQDFAGWGIPTAEAIADVRAACPAIPIIGSGGIRSGVDLAKALALGADLGGVALPLLQAAAESEEILQRTVRRFLEGLRVAMFCTGARDVADLRLGRRLRRAGRPEGDARG